MVRKLDQDGTLTYRNFGGLLKYGIKSKGEKRTRESQ